MTRYSTVEAYIALHCVANPGMEVMDFLTVCQVKIWKVITLEEVKDEDEVIFEGG